MGFVAFWGVRWRGCVIGWNWRSQSAVLDGNGDCLRLYVEYGIPVTPLSLYASSIASITLSIVQAPDLGRPVIFMTRSPTSFSSPRHSLSVRSLPPINIMLMSNSAGRSSAPISGRTMSTITMRE